MSEIVRTKDALEHLTPYQQGMQIEEVKKQFNLNKIVKLASNENPFGYSPKVKQYLESKDFNLEIYPDGHASVIREALANRLDISQNQLVFGSGSDELVAIIARTYLTHQSNTIMATPTFPQYKHHALIEGAEVIEVPVTETGAHDLVGMLNAVTSETRVIWLCTPNNPTGNALEYNQFTDFMNRCPKEVLVVLDEAYYEFLSKDKDLQAIELLDTYKNLLILRTFSKAYGLAGIRIGYGIGHEVIVNALNVIRGPFNTSSIAQELAVIALEDETFLQEVVHKNRQIRTEFEQFLDQLGWTYYPSETNFLFIKTPVSDDVVFNHLLQKGFIVRPGSKLGMPNTIRITIGQADDMKALQDILKTVE